MQCKTEKMGSSPSHNISANSSTTGCDAGEVQGRIKDTKSGDNSVPGRTKDKNNDSYYAVGGVKVGKHSPDSVPGRVKDTQTIVGAVSGRVVDKNNDQSSVPGPFNTQTIAGAVSGRVVDKNNDQSSVPGPFNTQTIAGAVSGRVVDKNNDQSSVPGRKLDSSSDTDTVPSVLDLTVSDIKLHNVGCEDVQSVVFMPSGHIVLTCRKDGLKLLDKHFNQLSQLSLFSVCSCRVSDTEVLVSQGDYEQILFVEVLPKMVAKNVLPIGKPSYGICYHNGEIYVACCDDPGNWEVRVVDMEGTLIRRLGVHDGEYMFTEPWDVQVNNAGDKVFVSDEGNNSVTCMDQSGKVLYQYTDTDMRYPYGILVDRQDNILVTAYMSDNVHVINNTGKQHKILLTEEDGLLCPYCISYRQDNGLLAIGMFSGDGTKSLMTMKTSLS